MRGWPLTTRGRASSTDVGVNVPLETVPSSSSVRDARAGPPLRGERHVTGLANQHAPSLCPAHSPAACWGLARAPARQPEAAEGASERVASAEREARDSRGPGKALSLFPLDSES